MAIQQHLFNAVGDAFTTAFATHGVFPDKPNRTEWNPRFPELHTRRAAIIHVVKVFTDRDEPVSPLQVGQQLELMGFGSFDLERVRRCIQSVMSEEPDIVRVLRRHYPSDGGKSWAMYAYGLADSFEINRKDIAVAQWLQSSANSKRVDAVRDTLRGMGNGHFYQAKRVRR